MYTRQANELAEHTGTTFCAVPSTACGSQCSGNGALIATSSYEWSTWSQPIARRYCPLLSTAPRWASTAQDCVARPMQKLSRSLCSSRALLGGGPLPARDVQWWLWDSHHDGVRTNAHVSRGT